MAKKKSSDTHKRLLEKIQSMDLGSNMFWSPKQGRSTIRILPPVGEMEFFFAEVGQHYIDGKNHMCPLLSSDGERECPACEVNEALYEAGETEAAKVFRASRRFYMNVIVRGEEAAGPRIFTPGVTIFGFISALIGDPDYGEVYDLDDGTDISIDRTGTGIETEYQVVPKRSYSVLGTDDQIDEWLENAKDLGEHIAGRLQSYDDVAKATGADAYLDLDSDEGDEPEEDEEESASAAISRKLAQRKSASTKRGRRGGRRR